MVGGNIEIVQVLDRNQQLMQIYNSSITLPMIQIMYEIFGYILIFEITIFLIFAGPLPRVLKQFLIKRLMGTKLKNKIKWIQIFICIVTSIFFIDLYLTQNLFTHQKNQLNTNTLTHDIRKGYLSSEIQKIQRNKYINGMLIYTCIVVYFYMQLLFQEYQKYGNQPQRSKSVIIEDKSLLPKQNQKKGDQSSQKNSTKTKNK